MADKELTLYTHTQTHTHTQINTERVPNTPTEKFTKNRNDNSNTC